ncbi:hypothetical protein JOQ06_008165, partial [Pogonophryne albipinna]
KKQRFPMKKKCAVSTFLANKTARSGEVGRRRGDGGAGWNIRAPSKINLMRVGLDLSAAGERIK